MILARGQIVDVLAGADEALVLLDEECLRLTAVAAAVIDVLDEPRALGEVHAHLEAQFGAAPRGRVEEIVDDLVRRGAVVVTGEVRTDDP